MAEKTEKTELQEAQERITALETENSSLRGELTQLRRETALPAEIAEAVKEKMAAGLPREQAIEVSRRQLAWDEELAKAEKKPKTAKT